MPGILHRRLRGRGRRGRSCSRTTRPAVYRKLVVRDDRLAGAVLFGDTADALWYRDLIRQQAPAGRRSAARWPSARPTRRPPDHERAGLHGGAAPLSRRLRLRRAGAPRRARAQAAGRRRRLRASPQAPTRSISPPWPASRRPARSCRPRRRPSATSIPSMPTRASRPRAPRASSPRASTTSAGASTASSTSRRRRTPTCAACAFPTASSRTGNSPASPISPSATAAATRMSPRAPTCRSAR